jgi:hypothetical protein
MEIVIVRILMVVSALEVIVIGIVIMVIVVILPKTHLKH